MSNKRYTPRYNAEFRERAVRVLAEQRGITDLHDIEPLHVAAWVEMLIDRYASSTVKQRLAGVRELFNYLVIGGYMPLTRRPTWLARRNPCGSARRR